MGVVAHGECRVADRPVAGAAAEVAAQRCLQALWGQQRRGRSTVRVLVLIEREQRHHDARGAEAALAAVALDHGRLGGMEALAPRQALHGGQHASLELMGRGDAGVGAVEADSAVGAGLTNGHRAGTTVAGGAALLGAGLAERVAQQLEHAGIGRSRAVAGLPVKQEVDHRLVSIVGVEAWARERPGSANSVLDRLVRLISAWSRFIRFASPFAPGTGLGHYPWL